MSRRLLSLAALALLAALAAAGCRATDCTVYVHRDGTLTALRHYNKDGRLLQVESLVDEDLRTWYYTPRGELDLVRYQTEVQPFAPPPLGISALADPFERSDVKFEYDDDGRLMSATRTTLFREDNTALGAIPEADAQRTRKELYAWDAQGRLTAVRLLDDAERQLEPRPLLEVDRDSQSSGVITATRYADDGQPSEKLTWGYSGDRLIERTVTPCTRPAPSSAPTCEGTTTWTYTWDGDRLTAITKGEEPWATLTWDDDGNLTQVAQGPEGAQRVDTYTWDSRGRVTSRRTVDHAAIQFNQERPTAGDAFGQKARKAAKQTHFEESYVYAPQCDPAQVNDLDPSAAVRFGTPAFGTIEEGLDVRRRW